MVGKDLNYQVVYRGEELHAYRDGGWVFFQLPKSCGGGYWFGRTYSDCFWLEFEQPTFLRFGLKYLLSLRKVDGSDFDYEFTLEG